MIEKFRKRIIRILLLAFAAVAVLVLLLFYFSHVQEDRESTFRLLNIRLFTADVSGEASMPAETPRFDPDRMADPSMGSGSYLRVYIAVETDGGSMEMLGPGKKDEDQLLQLVDRFFATQKTQGVLDSYQFAIMDRDDRLLVGFADISSLRTVERRRLAFSAMIAAVLFFLWWLAARKIADKLVQPLEEAEQKQEDFIMYAGHELKTPVTVMKTSLDLLEREQGKSKYLRYAQVENEKMKGLVNEILEFSKIRLQQAGHPLAEMNLSSCLEGAALAFDAVAYEKGVNFDLQLEEDVCIIGDPKKLQRMAETLIENAIRHTAKGKTVCVSLETIKKQAAFSVRNEGKEIPPQEREKIFEKFYHGSYADEPAEIPQENSSGYTEKSSGGKNVSGQDNSIPDGNGHSAAGEAASQENNISEWKGYGANGEKVGHSTIEDAGSAHESHYGLGLAIAQAIAGQHGTRITVSCQDGWNIFQVIFPALEKRG